MATLTKPREPRFRTKSKIPRRNVRWSILPPNRQLEAANIPAVTHHRRLVLGEELFFAVVSQALTELWAGQQISSSFVWDSPRVKAILERPEGDPIDLTQLTEEEINALAREAKGMWTDHPFIRDSVEWVRELRRGLFRGTPEE